MDDGNPYEEQSDLTIKYLNTYPSPTEYITEKSINETEDLVIYPVIYNNGVDATNTTATVSATIDGNELLAETVVDLSGAYSVSNGYYTSVIPGVSVTITASEMDALSISGLFDVCFTITYDGSDPITANNTNCLTVTRGTITPTSCDMEAIFATSVEDFTPIATSLAIGPTDDLTFFPATKNNGPDVANNYADINILVNGSPIDTYSENLTGLTDGETMSLTETGSTITAAIMDMAGLSGTFEVCLQVTYLGTDANTENNTTCVSITRTTGLDEISNNIVSIYPNPARNQITLVNAENTNVIIFNLLGEIVASIDNASASQTIDISELTEGTYFVKVKTEVIKINIIK